ncbi:MAG: TraB/GumN family protein [Marinosulfonomonas sp.]
MKHFLLSILLAFSATPALSFDRCGGENLFDVLPVAEQEHLREIVAQSPYSQGNIWRASKPGSTVHILGTIHVPDPRAPATIDTGAALIAQADRVFFEVLQEDEEYMQLQMSTNLELAFIDNGPTLPELLTPEEWAELQDRLKDYGIPPFFAAKMQPWVLGMTLSIPACALPALTEKGGIDKALLGIADTYDIPMQGLDDIDELLVLLSSDPIEKQIEDLKLGLTMNSASESMFKTTKDLYYSGEHRMLLEFSKYVLLRENPENAQYLEQGFDEIMYDLLDARNVKWMEKLLPAIESGSSVIAVGAGHLSGELGILQQLENAGYEVTPYEG